MQVFSRAADESLIVGDDLIVTVVAIDGSKVTLAISSPNTRPRYREITVRCQAENPSLSPPQEELLSVP